MKKLVVRRQTSVSFATSNCLRSFVEGKKIEDGNTKLGREDLQILK